MSFCGVIFNNNNNNNNKFYSNLTIHWVINITIHIREKNTFEQLQIVYSYNYTFIWQYDDDNRIK